MGRGLGVRWRRRRPAAVSPSLQAQMLDAVGQAVIATDPAGTVMYWNVASEALYGWAAAEVVGSATFDISASILAGDDVGEAERRRRLVSDGSWTGELARRRRDGTTFTALVTDSLVRDESGVVVGAISVSADITSHIASEQQARTLAAQHAAVARVGELAVGEPDLRSVHDKVVAVIADVLAADVVSLFLHDDDNPHQLRLEAGVGFPDGVVRSHRVPVGVRSLAGYALERDEPVIVEDLAAEERFEPPWLLREMGVASGAAVVLRTGGRSVGVLSAYRRSAVGFTSDEVNVLLSIGNVVARAIERADDRAALSAMALTDQLTGLPNRSLFQDRLHHQLTHRDRGITAVLFIDIDDFKDVNDALGHEAGDEVLVVVARRLRRLCRESDTVARLGGDEFGVVSEQAPDVAAVVELAERLIAGVCEEPVPVAGREVRVGMSVGVAIGSNGSAEPSALLRDADSAMYRAKAAGGSRVRVFDDQMRLSAVDRLNLANDLRTAVGRGQLLVHYQPELQLGGDVMWAEALVRWQHPERGLLLPGEFIGLAEETGSVVEVGRWVLEQAVATMAGWSRLPAGHAPSSVAVNLSTWQLVDGDIVHHTEQLLDRYGVDPAALYFELTETALLREPEQSVAALDALRRLGVGLAIDDFGTGYSSLSYIRTLPVSAVKIDRTFVRGLGVDRRDDGIVDAIVALGRSFGILTIAEGVETEEQLAILTELGCDFVQGFLFSPALAPEDLVGWTRRRR